MPDQPLKVQKAYAELWAAVFENSYASQRTSCELQDMIAASRNRIVMSRKLLTRMDELLGATQPAVR